MNNYYERNATIGPQTEHHITMKNRKLLEISGVKEVDSFDNEEFLLQTVMGYLIVRGENLQMKNLDVEQGNVSIKGKIYELSYLDDQHGEKAKGFFSKLFK
ncbi:sporulation protein YabP [Aquibacillus salsiterrae]|uniref:Sporulation protein YabP n=1 Tax=Aquibacillus salsiterrae TaxID=2950439 RepID=A0A9X4AH88_9BACI|nr:sporulation protein YabP [Aquibacillus salsiterrae]MDC3417923.1 sporulation protein YabP [Aquibacillus salsiterrae]